jgi:hypothetical protein
MRPDPSSVSEGGSGTGVGKALLGAVIFCCHDAKVIRKSAPAAMVPPLHEYVIIFGAKLAATPPGPP